MHRLSDIATIAQIYSGYSDEEKDEALETLEANHEILTSANNLGIKGREAMERTRTSKMLAATTKDLRKIAREAHRRGLNRRLKPAQFKLLDPRGTHILSLQFFHDRADEKLVEMHVRASAHIKLIGKAKAIELFLDIPMQFVDAYLTGQEKLELMEHAIQINAVDNMEPDKPHEKVMINMSDIEEGNEATPNADKLSAEGNS